MKKLFYLLACHLLINCSTTVNAQQAETFDFESEMFLPGANYYDILKRGTDFYENHPDSNEDGDYSAFNRWALMWKDRVNQPGAVPGDFNIATKAYQSLLVNPLCNGSANVPSYWSPLGPMSMPIQSLGIITAVAALPSEPNIVYAGTSNGGLFRTTNAGVGASPTWVNITDQSHLPGAGISDIIINPTINSNGYHDLYIAYGAQRWNVYGIGVLKSTNNGSTWFQTDLNTTFFGGYKVVKKMLMHPSNSQILYAITNNEVYKTTVGGVNVSGTGWPAKAFQIAANNPLINLNDLTMNGTNSNIVYTTGSGEIWRYDDATTAWSRLDLNASFVIPVAPPGSTYLSKTVSLSSPYNSCYALIRYTYILNGPPYTKSYKYEIKIYNETTPTPTWSVIANPGMYGPYFIVSPAQNNVMYIGDDANRLINKSVNSGQSFSAVSVYNGTYNATTYTHADVRAVELIEASTTNGTGNNDFMLVGNDGGILYSRINGSTPAAYMNGSTPKVNWTNINGTGMNITQFSGFGGLETTKDLLVAGAQDNDIFRFYQGNWTVNVSCDGYECLIDPININTANQQPYVYGQKDCGLPAELILRQSSDGGQSFSPPATSIPEKGSGRKPMQFNTTNQNFYMAYRNLFRSATPSLILNTVPPTLNPSKISDFQTNSGVPSCWSVSSFDVNEDNPLIIYLAFEGPTFDLDMNSCSQNCQPLGAACPTNTTYVCCPFTAGPVSVDKKIFKTTDGGANWFDKTGGTSTNALHAVEWGGITDVVMNPDNPNEVYLTFNGFWDNPGGSGIGYGRVARSFDGGVNWEEYSQGLREFPVNQIVFQRGANAAYIATDIGVFYRKTDDPNSQWECFNNNLPISVYTDLEINYCSQKLRASSYGRGMWESDLASSTVTLASPGTINWNTPRRLANNLIIGNGVTLNITSDVNIAKGRKITVAPGGTLKIDGGHLYNGCNEMWDKINVDGPTATLNVLTNAIIEDAYIAAYTNNGGVIKIKNSILDQNQIHVHIENVTTTSYAGYLFACTLQNTTGLQKPFTPGTLSSTAIEILNCNNIVIGNDAFSTQKNRLKDLINTGIRIVSSSVTIINCDIALATTNLSSRGIFASNTTSTPYDLNIGTRAGLICTAYSKNHISNFYHGIYINKNFSVHIVDNDIELIGLRGIYISQCLQTIEILKKMNTIGNYIHNSPAISYGIQLASNPSASSISIANNTLDLNKDAVGIYLTEYTCTDNPNTIISGNIINNIRQGIWVVNDGLPKILENEITFTTIPSNGVQGYGINVQNCCIPDIESNIIKATGAPDHLGGINAELCQQPYICNNITSYMEKGIICRGPMPGAKIKLNTMDHNSYGFALENSGAIGIQGALPSDVSDNQWISNGRDSYSATGSNTGGGPNFYVRSTGNYSINSTATVGTPAVTSFILSPFIAASCLDQSGWRPANQAMSAINLANTNDSVLTDEQKWLLNNQLYNYIKGDSTIDTSSLVVIQDFKDDLETQPVGKFNEVDNSISLAFSDTLALTADSLKMDSAQTTNTSIVTNKLIEFYKKIVNDIYLNTAARNNFVFTNDQITWLNTIAPLCPFEAGPAVYQARMLMTFVNDTLTFDDYICDSTAHFRIGKQPESNSFTFLNVYPNPAHDILFVDYILSKETKGEFVLCDIAGKELIINKLDVNQNQITIHCDKLSVGIYLYKLLSNGTVVKTGKLIKN